MQLSISHMRSPVTVLLDQQKRENGRRNYFMINFHENYVARIGLEFATHGFAVSRDAD